MLVKDRGLYVVPVPRREADAITRVLVPPLSGSGNLTGTELAKGFATYGSDSGHQGLGFPSGPGARVGGPGRSPGLGTATLSCSIRTKSSTSRGSGMTQRDPKTSLGTALPLWLGPIVFP
jgi:hypothetical protein